MKKIIATVAVGLLTAVAATAALAGDHGPPGGGHTPVTICHKPGTPAQQTLVVDDDSVELTGHLGHGDTRGPCQETPPPVDVCPNLDGNQSEVPEGYVLGEDENGRPACVKDEEPPPPPVDKCSNIEGNQSEVPAGYHVVEDENGRPVCVKDETPPPPTDVCPNIPGVQTQGPCETPPTHDCKPANPDGSLGGKDGIPGNDDCAADPVTPPPTTSTPPTVAVTATPPTTTPPTTTTVPPTVKPKPKPKPPVRKPAAKPKPKPVPKPDNPPVKKTAHVCKTLSDGTKRVWYKGGNGMKPGCYPVVMGSG